MTIIRHGVLHNGPIQTLRTGRTRLHAESRYNSLEEANSKYPNGNFTVGIERNCAGIGDMLMLTPSFKQIKKQYPNCELTLLTHFHFSNGVLLDVVKYNPYLDHVKNFIRGDNPQYFDFYRNVSPGWLNEEQAGKPAINRIDLFARDLGISIEDPLPNYYIQDHELQWAEQFIYSKVKHHTDDTFFIGIQLKSAALRRSWPLKNIKELLNLARGTHPKWHFFIFDHDTNEKFDYENIHNLKQFGFRQQAAILKKMNIFVGIDSGITHLAGALNIPIIALFGSTLPEARINYYNNPIVIQNNELKCLGCWYKPCNINYQCMTNIEPSIVLSKIESSINELTIDDTEFIKNFNNPIIDTHYDYLNIISMACFNHVQYTEQCIKSLINTNSIANNLLVITDNNSTDGTKKYLASLAEQYPNNIRVIYNKENIGFGNAHNNTYKQFGHLAEYFVIINNDITLPYNWLSLMRETFDYNTAIVGVKNTCCSLYTNGGGYEGETLEYIEGSCMMILSSLIKKHGLFDTKLFPFAYCEDADLSLRYRELQYDIKQAPVYIQHARGITSNSIPNIKSIQDNNNLNFKTKWNHYLKNKTFTKTILIKRYASNGDVYLVTPIINALKKQNPFLKIDILTKQSEIFRNNTQINRVHKEFPSFINYNQIIDLDNSYESRPKENILNVYADVAGVPIEECKDFYIFKEPYDLNIKEQYIVMHPGSTNWVGRNWYGDRFNKVVSFLKKNYHYKIIVIGDNATPKLKYADLDLRNQLSIHQLADIISKASYFIGIDSFPFHIAQGENIPSIVIFGCILPEYRIVRDNIIGINDTSLECIGCHHNRLPPVYNTNECIEGNQACMNNITAEIVINKIKELEKI